MRDIAGLSAENEALRRRIETLEETLAQERYVVAELGRKLEAKESDRLLRSRPSWEEMDDEADIRENDRRLVATYMEGC